MISDIGFRIRPFMKLLPPELARQVTELGTRRTFQSGQLIQSRGDDMPGLSVIEEGAAQAGVYGPDGNFVLTSHLGRGHTFGEFTVFTELPRTHDVSAVGATSIVDIPARRFLALCDAEPECLRALLVSSLMRSHILLEMLDAIRRLPLVPGTAKFLLMLAPADSTSPDIRFRQSDLASSLGISRATLSRAIASLAEHGFVEPGYGSIRITDRSALQAWLSRQ